MGVTHPSKRVHDWRPRSLRFAHWRDDSRHVGFSGDSHREVGHDAADRFALMLHLARHHAEIDLELDGARLHGTLGEPGDDGRTPFRPPAYQDGSLPEPTRGICWLRWSAGRHRHLAECAVHGDLARDRWLLSIPRAVESDDRRLLPRRILRAGWSLEAAPSAPAALRGRHRIQDLSLVGAAIVIHDLLVPEMVLEKHFVATLHAPEHPPERIQATVRNLRQVEGGAVLGLATHGAGFAGLRRLDSLLARP